MAQKIPYCLGREGDQERCHRASDPKLGLKRTLGGDFPNKGGKGVSGRGNCGQKA